MFHHTALPNGLMPIEQRATQGHFLPIGCIEFGAVVAVGVGWSVLQQARLIPLLNLRVLLVALQSNFQARLRG